MQIDQLQKLNQRIAEDTQLLHEQKARIKELKREGQETAQAEEILGVMEETLEDAMAERDMALRAIEMQCLTEEEQSFLRDTDGPFGGIPAVARRFLHASSGLRS